MSQPVLRDIDRTYRGQELYFGARPRLREDFSEGLHRGGERRAVREDLLRVADLGPQRGDEGNSRAGAGVFRLERVSKGGSYIVDRRSSDSLRSIFLRA